MYSSHLWTAQPHGTNYERGMGGEEGDGIDDGGLMERNAEDSEPPWVFFFTF